MKIIYPEKIRERIRCAKKIYKYFLHVPVQEVNINDHEHVVVTLAPQNENSYLLDYFHKIQVGSLTDYRLYENFYKDEKLFFTPKNIEENKIIFCCNDFLFMFRLDENLRFLRHYIVYTPKVLSFLLENAKVDLLLTEYLKGEPIDNPFNTKESKSIIAEQNIAQFQIINIEFSSIAIKYIDLLRCIDRQVREDDEKRIWKYRMYNDPEWEFFYHD